MEKEVPANAVPPKVFGPTVKGGALPRALHISPRRDVALRTEPELPVSECWAETDGSHAQRRDTSCAQIIPHRARRRKRQAVTAVATAVVTAVATAVATAGTAGTAATSAAVPLPSAVHLSQRAKRAPGRGRQTGPLRGSGLAGEGPTDRAPPPDGTRIAVRRPPLGGSVSRLGERSKAHRGRCRPRRRSTGPRPTDGSDLRRKGGDATPRFAVRSAGPPGAAQRRHLAVGESPSRPFAVAVVAAGSARPCGPRPAWPYRISHSWKCGFKSSPCSRERVTAISSASRRASSSSSQASSRVHNTPFSSPATRPP